MIECAAAHVVVLSLTYIDGIASVTAALFKITLTYVEEETFRHKYLIIFYL